MKYIVRDNYYSCPCGGTFSVQIGAPVYGVAPCVYHYECGRCRAKKVMPCRSEVKSLIPSVFPIEPVAE